jgi:tryptophan synthase alpha subunit
MPNSKAVGVAFSDPLLDGARFVPEVAANTAALTDITFSAPGTPDYAIQDLTNSSGYGFVTADEGQTVLSVIKNLQTRVSELETKLATYGLLP